MCERFTRTFPGIPASVASARAWVAEILSPRVPDGEAIGDAQLVVSELVTNALQHTSSGDRGMGRAEARLRAILGRVHLRLLLAPHRIRVEVTDTGTSIGTDSSAPSGDSRDGAGAPGPMVRCPDPDAEHGRGLALVDHLAQRWFWRGDHTSRTVTADLAHQPADAGHSATAGVSATARAGGVPAQRQP
ncbi:ATP-binding protein [Lipingzhangella sp. LS1_29]|uniref:ATP-binding protein n=1 Tax=Lipingzhangella rawalii TaxID=2055835 RepID=A0ABU2H946_9ACTN|nr:ATP-binding protein [Lipingzhangella rawalii]MDS1271827.1 ATP-binding protein [Lipingzhangella rawalii]